MATASGRSTVSGHCVALDVPILTDTPMACLRVGLRGGRSLRPDGPIAGRRGRYHDGRRRRGSRSLSRKNRITTGLL